MPAEKRAPPGRARASGNVGRPSWYETTYRPRAAVGDLPAVLEALGHHVGRDGKIAGRDERTPSLHVYGDHAHDFGSGEHYTDPLALLEALEGISHEEARDRYADVAGIPRFDGSKPGRNGHAVVRPARLKRPATKAGALDTSWLSELTDQAAAALERGESPEAQRARAYLDELGIPDAVTERLRLGVIDGSVALRGRPWATAGRERRLWMPYLGPDGRTIYGTARAIFDGEEGPKTLVHRSDHVGPCPAPYNAQALERSSAAGYVLLLEGEKDTAAALAALGVDAPALGLRGGTLPTDGTWPAKLAAVGVPVVVCFDRDDAGAEKAAKMVHELTTAGCSDVRRITVPAPHKDAADVLTAEGPDLLAEALEVWHDAASQQPLRKAPAEHLGPPPRDPTDPLAGGARAATAPTAKARPGDIMPPGRLLTAAELAEQEIPPLDPVIDGLIVPGLVVFAGPWKIGKSWFVLQMCRAVATEERFFNRDTNGGRAIYYALEDSPRRLQTRLMMQGIDARRLTRLHLGVHLKRTDEGGLAELEDVLDRYPGTRLVVIDTLAKIKPTRVGNGTAYDTDSHFGAQLQRIALDRDIALVLVTHLRKMPADDVFDTITGSAGVPGAADTVIVLKRKRGEADAVLHVTSRDFGEREDALRFDAETGTWHMLGNAAEHAVSKQRRAIIAAVRALETSGQSTGPADVAAFVGDEVSPNTVRQLMPRMVADGLLRALDRGKYTLGATVANVANVAKPYNDD